MISTPTPTYFVLPGQWKREEETRYKPGFTLSQLCNIKTWLHFKVRRDTQTKTSANYTRAKVGEKTPVNLGQSYRNIWNLILIQDVYKQLQIAKIEIKPKDFSPPSSCRFFPALDVTAFDLS